MHVPKTLVAVSFLVWSAFSPILPAYSATPPETKSQDRLPASEPTTGDFDKAIERLRRLDPAMADDYLALKTDVLAFVPELVEDESKLPVVSASTIADFDRRLHRIHDRAGLIDKTVVRKGDGEAADFAYNFIWLRVSLLCVRSGPVDIKELSGALTVLESGAEMLDKETASLNASSSLSVKQIYTERLHALNAYGTRVWNRLQAASLNVADMGNPVSETPGRPGGEPQYEPNIIGRLGLEVNPLQKRVADLARKLQRINDRLWGKVPVLSNPAAQTEALRDRMNPLLADPFGLNEVVKTANEGNTARARGLVFNQPLVIIAEAPKPAAKTLLDMARVPSPGVAATPDVPGPKPAVYTGGEGRDSSPKDVAKVNTLRKQGLTRTIGDPARRAAYVYQQEGETCGIAAQVEVLADSGVVPANATSLKAKEDELYQRAERLDYFAGSTGDPKRRHHGGTLNEHVGDLLDMPVRKTFAATDEQLLEAVKGGRMVIVGADTERLWNDRRYRGGGHFVAITGAELDRKTGAVLGYYINDTGTNEGGRFVALKQFNAAWHRHSRMIVEPL